jgi:hypothetical protein
VRPLHGPRWTRVAAIAVAALAATASAAAVRLEELSWTFGARTHFLRVGPPVGADPLPGLELPVPAGGRGKGNDRERPATERRLLLSVVGPIVSRYIRAAGGRGADRWVTEHIETEWLDGYTFDLRSYLARNSRLPAELEGAHLERFAVVDWDGKDALTLAVERKGCERGRATCSLETALVVTPPPGGWRPWLEAAMRGHGLVQRRAAIWWSAKQRGPSGPRNPRAPIR